MLVTSLSLEHLSKSLFVVGTPYVAKKDGITGMWKFIKRNGCGLVNGSSARIDELNLVRTQLMLLDSS